MALIASHTVPQTTVTIAIAQLTRGFLVTSVGDPRLQGSQKTKTAEEARRVANTMWAQAVDNRRKKG